MSLAKTTTRPTFSVSLDREWVSGNDFQAKRKQTLCRMTHVLLLVKKICREYFPSCENFVLSALKLKVLTEVHFSHLLVV